MCVLNYVLIRLSRCLVASNAFGAPAAWRAKHNICVSMFVAII